MSAESGQEKTEKATAKRRDDFRKKGQVAQSREVNTAVIMIGAVILWFFYAPHFYKELETLLTSIWGRSSELEVTVGSVPGLMRTVLGKMGLLLMPLLALTMILGMAASVLQIGWLFTTKPMEPDLTKLNPITGMKKFVSKRMLVELVKSLTKVGVVGFVAYRTVAGEFENALYLLDMDLHETLNFVARVTFLVLLKTCGVLIVLAIFDYAFTRYEMEEKMKMTKQETKDEHKQTEGDPHLKAKIRGVQMEMARKRMMAEVPTADVVVTNPTHLSVALRYERGRMDAPRVVAKGADRVALRIREIARENDVPLVENVPVARALFQVELGQDIPEDMFKAVAEILAYVYSLKGQQS
ncbi:flagellar biosynthetic protein FlhB [Geoalkalibacter ferrihydriticus]|uniref:Flagellar biosynthetic protein FlhB n=2 Tax=Geoalkalibacter ferrihydriticus TaxID=392333 RepID=A0A0C2HRV1_9BACT|nr:flagellar biosynthesis protein FlhB [Geoalkalibacter ferrihydriticus]KIH77555.1 flagellar biosynthesis protein FlhB [Geoalkalibacter ferrihydriticus DSM 17813]SDL67831.1 flagellar biosynthetic protein FlhB [Geoalkalibacter ferrihydriticus]